MNNNRHRLTAIAAFGATPAPSATRTRIRNAPAEDVSFEPVNTTELRVVPSIPGRG